MYAHKAKLNTVIFSLSTIAILIFGSITYLINPHSEYLWVYPILLTSFGILVFRKSPPITIILIFFWPYFFVPFHFFIKEINVSFWPDFQTPELINHVAYANLLFLVSLVLCISPLQNSIIPDAKTFSRKNSAVFLISIIACLYILAFGIRGESILEATYGQGNIEKTSLHEYFILPFLTALISKNSASKFHNILITFLMLFYCLKTVVYGGRIEALQVALLYSYLQWNFLQSVGSVKLYILLTVGFLGLTFVGFLRESHGTDLYVVIDSLTHTWNSFFDDSLNMDRGYVSTTAGDVTHASMRLLGLIQENHLTFAMRVESLFYFIFGAFVPSQYYPEHAILASFMQNKVGSGGGGLISIYFYVWIGWLGPIISGLLIGFVFRYFYTGTNLYLKIYGLLVLITFPRWFAYSPINLSKLCIIGLILLSILYISNRLLALIIKKLNK